MNKLQTILLSVIGLSFAIGFGMWAQSLFTISESMHFSVNFPAGEGAEGAQIMNCCDLGGPWARLSPKEQEDFEYPSGGVLVWGDEGCIVLDVGKEGFLKRTFQPGFINLSTHWLRNVSMQAHQIRLAMDLCDIPMEWETHESAWDEVTLTSTREIPPGEVFNMDWYFHIPKELLNQPVICEGKLQVFDAKTDKSLTVLPIKIINSRAQ